MTSTADTTTTAASSSITEHPVIEPIELDETMIRHLAASMEHATDLNRHRTAILRAAADPSTAAALYVSLTNYAVEIVEYGWPDSLLAWMGQHKTLACWVRRYAVRGLTDGDDDLGVHVAQTRIARLLAGFPASVTEDELILLHHDPVALIRATYAITRDLTA